MEKENLGYYLTDDDEKGSHKKTICHNSVADLFLFCAVYVTNIVKTFSAAHALVSLKVCVYLGNHVSAKIEHFYAYTPGDKASLMGL